MFMNIIYLLDNEQFDIYFFSRFFLLYFFFSNYLWFVYFP